MTEEEKQFVALTYRRMLDGYYGTADHRHQIDRLLTLLIESEAMRKKAEWQLEHNKCWYSNLAHGMICTESGTDIRHSWSVAQWIAETRKELSG
mgnify:CR=1 FL=1